jgi:hypothetical protein
MMGYFDPTTAEIGDTLYLSTPRGWNTYDVSEWTVTRKTQSGQIVCKHGEREMRLTRRGRIVGQDTWSRISFVSAEHAAELRAEAARHEKFQEIERRAEDVMNAARKRDAEKLTAAFAALEVSLNNTAPDASPSASSAPAAVAVPSTSALATDGADRGDAG